MSIGLILIIILVIFLLGGFSGRFGGYGYGFGHGGIGVIGLVLIILSCCFSWASFDLLERRTPRLRSRRRREPPISFRCSVGSVALCGAMAMVG